MPNKPIPVLMFKKFDEKKQKWAYRGEAWIDGECYTTPSRNAKRILARYREWITENNLIEKVQPIQERPAAEAGVTVWEAIA